MSDRKQHRTTRRLYVMPAALTFCAALGSAAAPASAGYLLFHPKGSTDTEVRSINDKGAIAGYYYIGNTGSHGFVRESNGKIRSFDPAGSRFTYVDAINNTGTVAGAYLNGSGYFAYVRAADGTITTFAAGDAGSTDPRGLSDRGVITGLYVDHSGVTHGFVRAASIPSQ